MSCSCCKIVSTRARALALSRPMIVPIGRSHPCWEQTSCGYVVGVVNATT